MMPKNEPEYGFMVCSLLISAIFNAIIFGDIAGLVDNISKESQTIQDLNDRNNGVMKEVKIPDILQDSIREFF